MGVVVEGTGDAKAIGSIIHRTLSYLEIEGWAVGRPINAKGCSNLDKPEGIERFVLAASQGSSAVLVIRDGDKKGTAPILARKYAERLRSVAAIPVGVVVPVKEIENWFVASLESIKGVPLGNGPGLRVELELPPDVEALAGKGFFLKHLPSYKESVHQALLAYKFDPSLCVDRSCSFRKFCKRLRELDLASERDQVVTFPEQ